MRKKFPQNGKDADQLLEELNSLKANDLQWKKGRAFSYVYYAEDAITETLKKAYLEYFSENALNPSAFPSLLKMENEVVSMCLDLFDAQEYASGNMTSGGTESILMSLKSAKEYAKLNKPHITKPEILLPISAHPAFDKGCDYFGLNPKKIEIGEDYRVDVDTMKEAISDNTIMMVASAPSYPQGVIDPIKEIGQLALENDVLFHVDACVGGFVLPFMETTRTWNMSVEGVTSMSADIHKYGFASKGSSVILYNNPELRKAQYYVYTDWPGGMYGSPAILGTKPGGAIAVAWTILHLLGNEGYIEKVASSLHTVKAFQNRINSFEGLKVFGDPDMCIFSFGSNDFNIYELGDEMHLKGWLMDRQQNPSALHLSISPYHANIIDEFFTDFETCLKKAKKPTVHSTMNKIQVSANKGLKKLLPSKTYKKVQEYALSKADPTNKRSAALYGMIGDLKGEGETEELIKNYLDKLFRES